MEFFEKLKKTVVNVSKKAADKSTDLVETTKLKFALTEKENELDKLYRDLGEAVFNSFKNGDVNEEIISGSCDSISAKIDEISVLSDKLREYKNMKLCFKCGSELSADSEFCNKCGEKV